MYLVFSNMPGFLPEHDNSIECDTLQEVWEYLDEELAQHVSHMELNQLASVHECRDAWRDVDRLLASEPQTGDWLIGNQVYSVEEF